MRGTTISVSVTLPCVSDEATLTLPSSVSSSMRFAMSVVDDTHSMPTSLKMRRFFGPVSYTHLVTTEGIDLLALPLGTRVRIGEDVLLELSQIGKVCHTKCAIYHLAGDCIFPREGIFFVALEGGAINVGDPVEVVSLGDGTCAYTPPEALAELAAATR